MGNLYKLDGKVSNSYAGKRDRDREDQRQRGARGEDSAVRGSASGVAGQLNKNVQVCVCVCVCVRACMRACVRMWSKIEELACQRLLNILARTVYL